SECCLVGSARCADRTPQHGVPTLSISLLTGVDEDLPAVDALQFQNATREPGIVLQLFANFIFVVGIHDEKGATRQPSFIDQRSAHENEALVNEIVDESRVFIPERLLTRALR